MQYDLRNLCSDLEWSTALKNHLRYTMTMRRQYNTPITTRRVMLSSTSILSTILLRREIHDHTNSLEHISIKRMLAYPFIKCLPPNVFKEHVACMGLRKSL
jgi:hypothetical protein